MTIPFSISTKSLPTLVTSPGVKSCKVFPCCWFPYSHSPHLSTQVFLFAEDFIRNGFAKVCKIGKMWEYNVIHWFVKVTILLINNFTFWELVVVTRMDYMIKWRTCEVTNVLSLMLRHASISSSSLFDISQIVLNHGCLYRWIITKKKTFTFYM